MKSPGAVSGAFARAVVIAALLVTVGACVGGDDPPDAAVQLAEYVSDLEEICRATAAELEALPTPPEMITVADFSAEAASILAREADAARRLVPPRDGELDDDHRAFVRNTDEQAAAWQRIADAQADASADGSGDAVLTESTTQIGELVLGRDELVAEMGAPGCARTGAAATGSDS